MSKIKLSNFQVNSETQGAGEIQIKNLEPGTRPVVKKFEMATIQKAGEGNYASVKARYGPLAATDPNQPTRTQKDSRFSLNPLLRDPLSIEQEERRAIEERVRIGIDAISAEARSAAEKQGYDDGLKLGLEQASKKVFQEGMTRLEKLDLLVTEMEGAKLEIFQANERFLIELVYRVARMVLLRELSTDRDYILRLVKELVNRVGLRDHLTLRIHPEDAQTIGLIKEGMDKAFGALTNLNIEVSNQVKRGGCHLESEWSAVETDVDSQLNGIHEALLTRPSGGGA